MAKVTAKIETVGGERHLILSLPLHDPELTESKKSYKIASAFWEKTGVEIDGKEIKVHATAVISARA